MGIIFLCLIFHDIEKAYMYIMYIKNINIIVGLLQLAAISNSVSLSSSDICRIL